MVPQLLQLCILSFRSQTSSPPQSMQYEGILSELIEEGKDKKIGASLDSGSFGWGGLNETLLHEQFNYLLGSPNDVIGVLI